MRLLIVEDQAEIHRYYTSALLRAGVEFDVVETKIEALELLKRRSYGGAIIDLQLSDDRTYAPGKEVLAYANKVGEGTVCYVVSGSPHMEDVLDTWKGGAFTFIQKSSASNQEIALRIASEVKDVKLKTLGKFQTLNVYLAHPAMSHQWESFLNQALNCGYDKMQQALQNSLGSILPILRLKVRAESFDLDSSHKMATGVFWSKSIGSAVQVILSGLESSIPKADVEQVVKTGRVGNDVYYTVFKRPDVSREDFCEFVDETPWK